MSGGIVRSQLLDRAWLGNSQTPMLAPLASQKVDGLTSMLVTDTLIKELEEMILLCKEEQYKAVLRRVIDQLEFLEDMNINLLSTSKDILRVAKTLNSQLKSLEAKAADMSEQVEDLQKELAKNPVDFELP